MCFFELFLDTIVLYGILWWFLQNDMPDIKFVFFIAFGLGIVNGLLAMLIGPFVVIPAVILTAVVLMFYGHLPLGQAALGTAAFLAYKIGLVAIIIATR